MATGLATTTRCSFCTKQAGEVSRIVAGAGVSICNECVALCNDVLAVAASESGQTAIPPWQTMSDEEMLSHLPRIAAVARQVDDDMRVWVRRLRARKVTWARIGDALGMSRQSAGERFAGKD